MPFYTLKRSFDESIEINPLENTLLNTINVETFIANERVTLVIFPDGECIGPDVHQFVSS